MKTAQTHPAELYCEGSYSEAVRSEVDSFDSGLRQCFCCQRFVRTYGGERGFGRLMAHRVSRGEIKDSE